MNFITSSQPVIRIDHEAGDPFDSWITASQLGGSATPVWTVYTEIIEYDTYLYMVVSNDADIVTTMPKDTELTTTFSEDVTLNKTFEEEVEL